MQKNIVHWLYLRIFMSFCSKFVNHEVWNIWINFFFLSWKVTFVVSKHRWINSEIIKTKGHNYVINPNPYYVRKIDATIKIYISFFFFEIWYTRKIDTTIKMYFLFLFKIHPNSILDNLNKQTRLVNKISYVISWEEVKLRSTGYW